MAQVGSGAHDADDARLLNLVRAGDTTAFGILYERHHQAARRLARELVASRPEVDDVVAETFARVLDIVRRGGGPADAFRPYLLAALRRVCYDRLRDQRVQVLTETGDLPHRPEPFEDPAVAGLEASLIVRAFMSLPERWTAVLWHTEIEQASPAEVAPIFGLSRGGVTALKRRAREGLRQAYLQMHISHVARQECRPFAERLGGYVRGALSRRDTLMVADHLDQCADCSAVCAELADINSGLRGLVAPLFLGGAAAAYLGHATGHGAGIAAGAAAGHRAPMGGSPAGARPASAAAPRGVRGLPSRVGRRLRQVPRRGWIAAGIGTVTVVAITALAVALSGPGSPPSRAASTLNPAQVRRTQPAAASARTSPPATATPSASVSPLPSQSPTPAGGSLEGTTPPPEPSLAASIDVSPVSTDTSQVVFTVTDSGNARTAQLTATVTLPAGSSVRGGAGNGNGWPHHYGWTCQPTATGATCTHASLSPGQKAQEVIFISVGAQACGKPVQLTVTSGSLSATAQTPHGIQCG